MEGSGSRGEVVKGQRISRYGVWDDSGGLPEGQWIRVVIQVWGMGCLAVSLLEICPDL